MLSKNLAFKITENKIRLWRKRHFLTTWLWMRFSLAVVLVSHCCMTVTAELAAESNSHFCSLWVCEDEDQEGLTCLPAQVSARYTRCWLEVLFVQGHCWWSTFRKPHILGRILFLLDVGLRITFLVLFCVVLCYVVLCFSQTGYKPMILRTPAPKCQCNRCVPHWQLLAIAVLSPTGY